MSDGDVLVGAAPEEDAALVGGSSAGDSALGAAPSNGLMLEASHVRFGYESGGGEAVLRDVTLAVERGTCMLLVGVNGCGKSTFLDCVLGEHSARGGDILVAGRPVDSLKASQMARLVSYVPQVHERSFPYTVGQIVLMGRTVWSSALAGPGDDDVAAADRALAHCGVGHLRERPYTSLSGGEMQMVMLARALAQEAPLVLMDEPTAHLDFKNELMFLETVEQLVSSGRTTVLMATHSPNQAFRLESAGVDVRVAVMSDGCIQRCGLPGEILGEEMFRDVFGVRACLLEGDVSEADVRGRIDADAERAPSLHVRQIVALGTTDAEGADMRRRPDEGEVVEGGASASEPPVSSACSSSDGKIEGGPHV